MAAPASDDGTNQNTHDSTVRCYVHYLLSNKHVANYSCRDQSILLLFFLIFFPATFLFYYLATIVAPKFSYLTWLVHVVYCIAGILWSSNFYEASISLPSNNICDCYICKAILHQIMWSCKNRDVWNWIFHYRLYDQIEDQRIPCLQGYLVSCLVLVVTSMELWHVQIYHWAETNEYWVTVQKLKSASRQQLA